MHPTLATRRRLVRLRRLVALVTLAVAAFIPIRLAMTLIPSSTVVVAREDLAAGRVLTTRDVDVRRIPPSGVLPGMSSMAGNVVGRVLLVLRAFTNGEQHDLVAGGDSRAGAHDGNLECRIPGWNPRGIGKDAA